MSTGSFGSSMRNGLKTDTATMLAIARTTAAGTAIRSTRTIRLWRAAAGKARLHSGDDRLGSEPNSPLLQRREISPPLYPGLPR